MKNKKMKIVRDYITDILILILVGYAIYCLVINNMVWGVLSCVVANSILVHNRIKRLEEKISGEQNEIYNWKKQCRECICSHCDYLKTNNCYLNDNLNNMRKACDNKSHTVSC